MRLYSQLLKLWDLSDSRRNPAICSVPIFTDQLPTLWAKPLQSKKYNANIHGICQLIAKHTVNGLVMCQVCARVQKSTMPTSKGFQKKCWEMMCLIHLKNNLHYRLDWKQKHMCIVESQRSTHSASKWHQIFSILESHHQPINQTKQSVE